MEAIINFPADAGDAENPVEMASGRRDLYRFLSSAFLETPTSELLAVLCEESFQQALEDWCSPEVLEYFQQLPQAMNSEGVVNAVRQEFTNLFIVPGGQYVAPYESVHRDSRLVEGREVTGLLMGQSAQDVQKWYRLAALELDSNFKELPDHIGLEFHYLAYLCEKEREFGAAGDTSKLTRAREMQRDFLKAHVLSWLGKFRDEIRSKAALPLYPAIASLAIEFCQGDLAALEAALGPSSGKPIPDYAT